MTPQPTGLGVALGWHALAFEELLDLVQRAEAQGYQAAYVDGDVSQIESRGEGDVLDGWTLGAALLQRTERIQIGSIRLVHHWNAARLAQAVATLERISPGRQRFLISIGGQPADARFGLPLPPARERIAWLDETLDAVRALWRGEEVEREGRFVQLHGARVRPRPIPPPAIEVAARGRRLLRVVARHANAWNINLPPIRERVEKAAAELAAACRAEGRAPDAISRVMWIFCRPHGEKGDPEVHAAFRRWNPWFASIPDHELPEAVVTGDPDACRTRLSALTRELCLTLPVVDLSGLAHDAARRAIDALRPGETRVDSNT